MPAAARRFARARGYEGLDKRDPFGEKRAWDEPVLHAKLANVDLDVLGANMASDEVQTKHFGPEWAKRKTVVYAASKRLVDDPEGARAVQKPNTTARDGSEVTATQASAKWTSAHVSSLPQTYQAFVEAEEEDQADEEVEVPQSLRHPGASGGTPVTGTAAPASHADAVVAATVQERMAAPLPAADGPSSSGAAAESEDGISNDEPLTWTTAHVVAWLKKYAAIDDDMASAFEMVGVDGRMLLNDVTPCNMFKEMRRWHNRGRKQPPELPELLVQETIYLCYPYGK